MCVSTGRGRATQWWHQVDHQAQSDVCGQDHLCQGSGTQWGGALHRRLHLHSGAGERRQNKKKTHHNGPTAEITSLSECLQELFPTCRNRVHLTAPLWREGTFSLHFLYHVVLIVIRQCVPLLVLIIHLMSLIRRRQEYLSEVYSGNKYLIQAIVESSEMRSTNKNYVYGTITGWCKSGKQHTWCSVIGYRSRWLITYPLFVWLIVARLEFPLLTW